MHSVHPQICIRNLPSSEGSPETLLPHQCHRRNFQASGTHMSPRPGTCASICNCSENKAFLNLYQQRMDSKDRERLGHSLSVSCPRVLRPAQLGHVHVTPQLHKLPITSLSYNISFVYGGQTHTRIDARRGTPSCTCHTPDSAEPPLLPRWCPYGLVGLHHARSRYWCTLWHVYIKCCSATRVDKQTNNIVQRIYSKYCGTQNRTVCILDSA